jgi:hypothetical protein
MTDLSFIKRDCRSLAWIRDHLDYPHKDPCLFWPFGRSKNGYAYVGKSPRGVHRVMCEHRNGPPPSPEHQAAHSCGKGHLGCVNPHHLNWKTVSENQIERYQHSGLTKKAKLTPAQVDEIRALEGRAKVNDIAEMFGVSDTTIRSILSGKLWNDTVTLQRRFLTEAEVIAIRTTPWEQKSLTGWAKELGISVACVDRIRHRRTYKWVPDTVSVSSPVGWGGHLPGKIEP